MHRALAQPSQEFVLQICSDVRADLQCLANLLQLHLDFQCLVNLLQLHLWKRKVEAIL